MKTHPALKGTPPSMEGISRAKYIVLPIEGERSEGQRGFYNY